MTKSSILDRLIIAAHEMIENDYSKRGVGGFLPPFMKEVCFEVTDTAGTTHSMTIEAPGLEETKGFQVKRNIEWQVSDKKDYFMGGK